MHPNKASHFLALAVFLSFGLSFNTGAAQTARLQVIHNAADPAADTVTVYLNGTKLLSNFAFRTATPFIDAPAGQLLNIGIAGKNSVSANDTLKNFQVTLTAGQKYVAIASGVVNSTGFAANPNGRNIGLSLIISTPAQDTTSGGNVAFAVAHGATDAPGVKVVARGVATLVPKAFYGDVTSYISVPAADYTLDVKDTSGTVLVATFNADLSGLANRTATVFASGFLTPSANKNGKAFGLFAALANGQVVPLPQITTARVQVIHNAADKAADSVDVYLNGAKLLTSFAFRTATPFIDAPAGSPINIGIAAKHSMSASDTLKNFQLTLTPGQKYVVIADGLVTPMSYAANPNGRNTALTLLISTPALDTTSGGNVAFAVAHGATDAPGVKVVARGVATLVPAAFYGDVTGYISVPAAKYTLDVRDTSGKVLVATFNADLSTLSNRTATVFASGFLNPSANQNGKAFGLFAALANGQVVTLPQITTARVQVIHNAADPAADSVTVYLNGSRLLSNFAFRTATPFIDAPAGTPINIGIAGKNSVSAGDTLKNFAVTLTPGATYVVIANGVLGTGFAANPSGRNTAFTLFVNSSAEEASATSGKVEFAVVHGSTDAPAVDVVARGVGRLVHSIAYGDITGYIAVPAASYTLDVKDTTSTTTVASFTADLSALANRSATVFASGFLNPVANKNGRSFGLFAALNDGTVVPFGTTTGIQSTSGEVPRRYELTQNYPNPFNPSTEISFSIPAAGQTTLKVYNTIGQEVATLVNGQLQAGSYRVTLNATNLASGVYLYRLQAGTFSSVRKMVLLK